MLVLLDRAKELSTTTGPGTYTLLGAVNGFQTFAGIGNGNTTWYEATDGVDWETGLGTWSTGGTLARTAIFKSTNGNAAVSWGVGTRFVFIVNPADRLQVGRQTVWIPAGAIVPRTTNGCVSGTVELATNKNMVVTKDFDPTTQQFGQFEIWFPKSWDLGTLAWRPKLSHPATVTSFGMVFGLAAVAKSDGDAGDVAFGTPATSSKTGGTTNAEYLGPESAALTVAGSPAEGDAVQFQVDRTVADGGDTLAVVARLHGLQLFYNTKSGNDV